MCKLDRTSNRCWCAVWSCLLALLLLFPAGTSLASEMYRITEQELTQLEINLTQLEQLSQTQQAELARLREALTKSEAELARLKNQLSTSSAQLTTAQQSLQTANLLLQQYAQEEKRTRLRIKAQRNAWEAAAGLLVIGLAIK
ncbi:MAG: hypothetical protein VZQ81_05690 [Succiniclasticum sp.]|nr:hypothetical protein [Succiniclasticum sp.]